MATMQNKLRTKGRDEGARGKRTSCSKPRTSAAARTKRTKTRHANHPDHVSNLQCACACVAHLLTQVNASINRHLIYRPTLRGWCGRRAHTHAVYYYPAYLQLTQSGFARVLGPRYCACPSHVTCAVAPPPFRSKVARSPYLG